MPIDNDEGRNVTRRNVIKKMQWWKGAILALACVSGLSQADGISFSRNRMVFPANDKAISIAIENHGDTPYLVQAGVSDDPEKVTTAPFVVTPPMFRLDGNAKNLMRIALINPSLPKDRESVYYFYARTIPGQKSQPGEAKETPDKTLGAQLSIAMRTVLKLFYRPTELPMTIDEAHKLLQFSREGNALLINNPTPYYQSFASLNLDGTEQDLDTNPSMVAPFSSLRFPTKQTTARQVTWQLMDDYGGVTSKQTVTIK
ncbi:MAG: molecular chaperone [Enterobacteriaceae bacterium]|jgi:fimbrial chaperone protein|nr:molecular chaperone [Enterobacteriaceae bacterium]